MRILFVEDNLDQLELLQTALAQAGHIVDGVQDGDAAQWFIAQRDYDLLILDWMLPQISGLSLCRQYREMGKTAPILMLTAKAEIQDKVAGLDAGADDYLVKPADIIELLARVKALGRRSPLYQGSTLVLEDFTLHLTHLAAERQGILIELSGREFQLLEYLVRHPRQILSRHQIEQALWPWGHEPESNAITTLVRRLRQRLNPLKIGNWIETVYGMGYRICPKL